MSSGNNSKFSVYFNLSQASTYNNWNEILSIQHMENKMCAVLLIECCSACIAIPGMPCTAAPCLNFPPSSLVPLHHVGCLSLHWWASCMSLCLLCTCTLHAMTAPGLHCHVPRPHRTTLSHACSIVLYGAWTALYWHCSMSALWMYYLVLCLHCTWTTLHCTCTVPVLPCTMHALPCSVPAQPCSMPAQNCPTLYIHCACTMRSLYNSTLCLFYPVPCMHYAGTTLYHACTALFHTCSELSHTYMNCACSVPTPHALCTW